MFFFPPANKEHFEINIKPCVWIFTDFLQCRPWWAVPEEKPNIQITVVPEREKMEEEVIKEIKRISPA